MTRRSFAVALAVLSIALVAWANPQLSSKCAPDSETFAWSVTLAEEENQVLELSFDGFATSETRDFTGAGTHDFTTVREGITLSVRYADDHNAVGSAEGNETLCEQPEPTPSESPTPTPSVAPSPSPEPSAPLTPGLPDTAVSSRTPWTQLIVGSVVLYLSVMYLALTWKKR